MSEWKKSSLGELANAKGCTIQTGPFGSQLHKGEYKQEGVGVINPTHIKNRSVSHDSVPHVSSEVAERLAKHKVRAGDLLFARRGEIGRHALIKDSEHGWLCGTGCFLVRLNQEVADPSFVSYFLSTDDSLEWLNRHASGVVMPNLSNQVLQKAPVQVPCLEEQKEISRILSTVERAIEAQERIIQTTTELKQALMQKLFSEGLRGEPQKETEIGLVPESWEVVPLGTLAKVGNGSTPKRSNSTYWDGGTIPWLNSSKIHDLFITEADSFVTPQAVKECHLPRVAPNSLLIAITGQGKTLGNSAITRIETSINQHLAYAQFHDARIVPEFVLWFMQTRYTFLRSIAHGNGSTKGALTCGYLKTLAIPVPSKPEQEVIAGTFQIIEERQSIAAKKQIHFRGLFHSLLHILMTAEASVNMFLQP